MIKGKRIFEYSSAVVALFFILAFGCQTAPVEAKSGDSNYEKKYPKSEYVTAVGTGESEPEAKNRALSELSKIFEAKVKSDTMDRVRSVVRTKGEKTSEDTEQRIESQLNVISNVELKGAEIAETWKEKSNHYALAVLERAKARDTWLREIEDLDKRISSGLAAAGEVKSKLMRYRALQEISRLWLEREVRVSRLSVLGYKEGGPKSYDPGQIFQELPRIKASMPIYLDISGTNAQEARDIIAKALGDDGFVITKDRAGAPVVISGSVEVKPVDIPHPEWKYARGAVSLEVRDVQANLTVGQVVTDKRTSHLSYDEAAKKAVKKVLPEAASLLVNFLEEPPKAE